MKTIVFLSHWSLAFVEEQFFALYQQLKRSSTTGEFIYFCEWNNSAAVHYLVNTLFQPTKLNQNFSNYPPTTCNNLQHQLTSCTADNTIFVLYFSPRHLEFFMQSTGQRFPKNYIWWQVEQASNDFFFSDKRYCNVIGNALAILEFSRSNVLENFTNTRLYAPFSRDIDDLVYQNNTTLDQLRIQNICNHQKKRLQQDNPSFRIITAPTFETNSVLLLGTCEPQRRVYFKQLCMQKNVSVIHPHLYNYYFGIERQEFIRNFVNSCGNNLAVAVNIHQYEDSVLEQAKIYLLLANGCDVVVSEKSRSVFEDEQMKSACGDRILFVKSLEESATKVSELCIQKRTKAVVPLKNPQYFMNLFKKLLSVIV